VQFARSILSICLRFTMIGLGVGSAYAQGSAAPDLVSAPVVGLLSNQDRTEVRAILGVPGASTLSDPIPLPLLVANVYLAPTQRWAIVKNTLGGGLAAMNFSGAKAGNVTPIAGALAAPDSVSFSPTGSAAALTYAAMGTMQILTGLDSNLHVGMTFQVSDLVSTGLLATAVSDDGTLAVVLTSDGSVYLLSGANPRQLIFRAGTPAGIGFFPNRASVAIVDGNAGVASVIDNLAISPGAKRVASGMSIPPGQVLVQPALDGQSIFAVATGGRSAIRIDISSGQVQTLSLGVTTASLERLRNGDTFSFSALPDASAWLLVSDAQGLRTTFAPLANPSSRSVDIGTRPNPISTLPGQRSR
jgi:hypothetical protein